MANASSSPPSDSVFSVQFAQGIDLTAEQVTMIEKAIQTAVAEQIAILSIPATAQPFLKPEGVYDPLRPFKYPIGLVAIPTEPPEIFGGGR